MITRLLSTKNLISKRGMLSQLPQHQMMGGGLASYWMKHEEWKEKMCSPATLFACSNFMKGAYRTLSFQKVIYLSTY